MSERKIWDTLIAKIGNPYGVAGLMGNLYAESGLRANNLQNSYAKKLGMTDEAYTAAVDDGSYTNFVRDAAGYGLAQWTYWSRKRNLKEFAAAAGKSIGDLDMQLAFLVQELASYTTVMKTLVAASSVQEASDIVLTRYEKPADQSDAAKKRRAGYGQKYFDAYAYDNDETESPAEEMAPIGITNKALAQFCIQCYENGVRYWYGTCYYKCTTSLLKSKTNQYPSHYKDSRKSAYQDDIEAGAMCCDCVGLIKGAVWSNLGTRESKYGTNGCPDKSASGMLAYCKSKGMAWGSMDTFPDIPGLLLHKEGHVGVSIGGGYAIEAKGFSDDVKRTKVAGRGWTSWAQLPFITYEGEDFDKAPITNVHKLGDRTLKRGCKGNDVAELQAALVALGYDCGRYGSNNDGVDGDYGRTTKAAVETFQADADIEIDGIYGPESHAALMEMQLQGGKPGDKPEEGGDGDDTGDAAPTFLVTVPGVDAATATYLLETYPGATAVEETA